MSSIPDISDAQLKHGILGFLANSYAGAKTEKNVPFAETRTRNVTEILNFLKSKDIRYSDIDRREWDTPMRKRTNPFRCKDKDRIVKIVDSLIKEGMVTLESTNYYRNLSLTMRGADKIGDTYLANAFDDKSITTAVVRTATAGKDPETLIVPKILESMPEQRTDKVEEKRIVFAEKSARLRAAAMKRESEGYQEVKEALSDEKTGPTR